MQFRERQVDGVTVIDVQGDLEVTAPSYALHDFVKDILRRGERRIVLNLERIDRVDSTCLGEVVESFRTTAMHGGALKIAPRAPHLARQLHITHLDKFIEMFDTEAAAIASFTAAKQAHKAIAS